MNIYTMIGWDYKMAGSDYWEGMLSAGQIDYIMDECKKSLAFGDYFDPYDDDDNLTSETTQYLVHVTTLLNKMVKAKESLAANED